jgi:hypothetical protein
MHEGGMKKSFGDHLRWRLRNAVWGAKWGVGLAAALSVVAAIPAMIRVFVPVSEEWKRNLSFPVLVAVYLVIGLSCGALVGFLRDIAETWWGRRVLGAVIGIPVMGLVVAAFRPEWLSLPGLAIAGAIWGFCMSFAFEGVSPRRRRGGWGRGG